jgi:hypothetical protein
MSEFKVLDSIWFTSISSHIGIVIGEIKTGERKAYIKSVKGRNKEADIDDIATWGTPFPLDAANELFKYLKPDQNQ